MDGITELLQTLSPTARDKLRRVLILDQAGRDAIALELLCYGDDNGDQWADIIDRLRCTRMHGERWRVGLERSRQENDPERTPTPMYRRCDGRDPPHQ